MPKYVVTAKYAQFDKIGEKFQISPYIARVIRNKDLVDDEQINKYLNGTEQDFYNPWLLKDLDKAIEILFTKIKQKKTIRIVGDYDIDGICATYILLRGLNVLGASVDYYIPHRIHDGYGMNDEIVETAHNDGIDTIVTCDNGIAASKQVELAKAYNMTVVITDHHEVPYEEMDGIRHFILPNADAIVDPKQEDCTYPNSGICGGFVAYKLIQAMFALQYKNGEMDELLEELLSFAGFATIGDVMELQDENRILVKKSLKVLDHTTNVGLKSLIQVNQLENVKLTPFHIGFVLGPCMNATGRLDAAKRALELLTAEDKGEAVIIANELKELNDSRKELTKQGVEQAINQVEEDGLDKDVVLVVYLKNCHESLAGIIAGRLRERYYRPVFVLTDAEDGLKGSGRSIEEFHMFEHMTMIKDVFTKYGGHKLAAGLSIEKEKLDEFRERINEVCNLDINTLEEKIAIDLVMPVNEITYPFLEQLHVLEPFGKGNEKPIFACQGLYVLNYQIIGKNQNVLKVQLLGEQNQTIQGVCFRNIESAKEKVQKAMEHNTAISMIYEPQINEFRGNKTIQFVINDIL